MKRPTLKQIAQEFQISIDFARRLRANYEPAHVDRMRSFRTYIRKLVNRALHHGEDHPSLRSCKNAYRNDKS